MSALFAELDYCLTPLGALSLRRRRNLTTGEDIHEILLGDEYLMSSRFTAAETALGHLGIDACPDRPLDVVVGGLGLGYTAAAVLEHPNVASLIVVDGLSEVIDWHRQGLLPLGPGLTADARCTLAYGNFFDLAASEAGFDPGKAGRTFDAIIVDIDHSPTRLLNPANAPLYTPDGLRRLRAHLKPDGVFALWSDDAPAAEFMDILSGTFSSVSTSTVAFAGLDSAQQATNSVYLAKV